MEQSRIFAANEKENLLGEKEMHIQELQQSKKNVMEEKERIIQELMKARDELKIAKENEKREMQRLLDMQRKFIGEYRNSVVYPFYRATHSFGETGMGKFLQKALKKQKK